MGVRRGGLSPPWILKLLAKKVVFSISRGKKQISPLLPPPGKHLGKIPYCPPPWKKSFRRPWQQSRFNIVYIPHSLCNAWNALLPMCLHGCATACALKQTFAYCTFFWGNTAQMGSEAFLEGSRVDFFAHSCITFGMIEFYMGLLVIVGCYNGSRTRGTKKGWKPLLYANLLLQKKI